MSWFQDCMGKDLEVGQRVRYYPGIGEDGFELCTVQSLEEDGDVGEDGFPCDASFVRLVPVEDGDPDDPIVVPRNDLDQVEVDP